MLGRTRSNAMRVSAKKKMTRLLGALLFGVGLLACSRTPLDVDGSLGASSGDSGGGNSGGTSSAGGGTGGASEEACRDDGDCITSDACQIARCLPSGVCEFAIRDQDGDGFTDALCGGTDCNDLNQNARPGGVEECADGSDNDCNGVADCFDPACDSVECGCMPALSGESCSNSVDDDCDGAVDCLDTDCMGTVECGCEPESCENGGDDDCDGLIDCADDDCFAHPACLCQSSPEDCTNGADDDCDGLIDCADPNCSFNSACLCVIPEHEVCTDGRDNDCNGLIDCGDSSCFSHDACRECVTEICSGGVDEDCDGLVDCSDPSCAFDPSCPPQPEQCNNGRDDDLDGLGDCNDPDCRNTQVCQEMQNTCATARRIEALASASYTGDTTEQLSNFRGSCGGDAGEAVFRLELSEPVSLHVDTVGSAFDTVLYARIGSCAFGQEMGCDDDSGGFQWSSALDFPLLSPGTYFIYVDGLTVDPVQGPNEGAFTLNVEVAPAVEICDDRFDNDGDGYADCADSDCTNVVGCQGCNAGDDPVAEYGVDRCTDGLDNDCDGLSDCEDDDCSASPDHSTECCNGMDENGNGIPDDLNCRCVSDQDCLEGEVCYTSTVSACAYPCNQFFGDLCPFIAPGSSCNVATGQCEF